MVSSAVLLVISGCILAAWLYSLIKHPKSFPPGPGKWPIVGNLPHLDFTKHWGVQFLDMSKKYGKMFSFKFGELEYVVLVDPADIRAVMNKDEVQDRPRLYNIDHMMNFQNAGILMASGEPWKERRRFCLRHLRDFGFGKASSESIILDEFKELVGHIRCSASSETKEGSSIVSLDEHLNMATANVIWWMMANKRVTSADNNFNNMAQALQQILSFSGLIDILSFMPSILRWCPGWVYGEKKMQKLRSIVHGYLQAFGDATVSSIFLNDSLNCQSVIEEHQLTLDPTSPRDLVDTFLIQRKADEKNGVQNDFFSDNSIIVTLLDLFNAGHETTATTLRWFFLYMLEYPEVQTKIHAEVDRVIGKDREPEWADYSIMPYTVAAINEVWRVANIVPLGADHTAEAAFSHKGYRFPKGTNFFAILYAVHVDPEVWGDPENFRPERFLDNSGKFVKNQNLMPFLVGKRQCMGESLARMVSFLGVVYILQLFSLEKVPGEKYTLEANIKHSPFISVPFPYKMKVTPRYQ